MILREMSGPKEQTVAWDKVSVSPVRLLGPLVLSSLPPSSLPLPWDEFSLPHAHYIVFGLTTGSKTMGQQIISEASDTRKQNKPFLLKLIISGILSPWWEVRGSDRLQYGEVQNFTVDKLSRQKSPRSPLCAALRRTDESLSGLETFSLFSGD
jgi:hypothetical protein